MLNDGPFYTKEELDAQRKEYEIEQEKFMNEIIEIEVSESDKTYKLKIKRSEIIKMINFSQMLDQFYKFKQTYDLYNTRF